MDVIIDKEEYRLQGPVCLCLLINLKNYYRGEKMAEE